MVMAVANEEPLKTAASELDTAIMKVQYAQYGIDYDEVVKQATESQESSDSTDDATSE